MGTILIIDDNNEFITMVSYYFTELGYKMIRAGDGRDGIDKAKTLKPDVIFLDVMMPGMSGIEVLRELQTYDESKDIPVIILTGTYFDRDMSELFRQEANCREFLSKTAELSYVQKKVESLLGGKK